MNFALFSWPRKQQQHSPHFEPRANCQEWANNQLLGARTSLRTCRPSCRPSTTIKFNGTARTRNRGERIKELHIDQLMIPFPSTRLPPTHRRFTFKKRSNDSERPPESGDPSAPSNAAGASSQNPGAASPPRRESDELGISFRYPKLVAQQGRRSLEQESHSGSKQRRGSHRTAAREQRSAMTETLEE